ncbi:MAG: Fic family protein [Flavobacteriales bacterium]|nr:Fic family protein [Flavobacteriales bacterium]
MDDNVEFYVTPDAMEPLFPDDTSQGLDDLAMELIQKSSKLSGTMNPITRAAIADFLRPMNSYYSNLIEGSDTHPIDIDRALKNDFSENKAKRYLQKEAHAHINVHLSVSKEFNKGHIDRIPTSISYLKEIHKRFYDHLPKEFRKVESKDGKIKQVIPGELRTAEVEVGRHIAPKSEFLNLFTDRFENFYDPTTHSNNSKIKRIISIAASHHRLAWIHPFLDGNGRVIRLYSDACFMYEGLHSSGLWSISRGLARSNEKYKSHLANADLKRRNDYDGRGNLSSEMLTRFCSYFLEAAIDQIDYMYRVIDTESMLKRLKGFSELMVARGRFKPAAEYILTDVFLKGKISKSEAMRITGTSDKTLKKITDSLVKMELLSQKKESISMMYYVRYPIAFSPMLFPGLYPADKEIDMTNNI